MRKSIATAEGVLGSPLRNLIFVLVFMAVVVVLATVAYMRAGWSFADASYMVTLTVYTVGYGEVRPIDTPYLHAVTMSTMVLGCTGMILLTSTIVQLFTELQLRQLLGTNRMQSRIDKLSNHVVICGYGRIGVMLARELADAGVPLVILEHSAEKRAEAEAAGHLTHSGDATSEAVLVAAGITRARVLATVLPDDAANVFITLSARSLAPNVEIIARGEVPTTESKLRHAGANQVVMPTHIGAERMARLVLFPATSGLNDEARLRQMSREFAQLGLLLVSITALEGSAAAGLSVAEAERRIGGAFFIVELQRGAAPALPRPAGSERIAAGDRVLIVTRDGGGAAHALFSTRAAVRVGRNVF